MYVMGDKKKPYNYIEHHSDYINVSAQHIDLPTNSVETTNLQKNPL